jgi:hypothetical protein
MTRISLREMMLKPEIQAHKKSESSHDEAAGKIKPDDHGR